MDVLLDAGAKLILNDISQEVLDPIKDRVGEIRPYALRNYSGINVSLAPSLENRLFNPQNLRTLRFHGFENGESHAAGDY